MTDELAVTFHRLTYRSGQRLTARDLEDDRRRGAWLRRLHLCYLHATWGIAQGLEVTPAIATALAIAPGYAIDEGGRELVLANPVQVPVPSVTGPAVFVLTLGCRENSRFSRRRKWAALCLDDDRVQRPERPSISWRLPGKISFGAEVPLALARVDRGQLQGEPDLRIRRNARRLTRPHIGSGTTEPGRTGWHLWVSESGHTLGLEVTVDTSGAGFTAPPYYFATLRRERIPPTTSLVEGVHPTSAPTELPLGAFSNVTRTSEKSFTYRIIDLLFGDAASPAEAEERQWVVSWMGAAPAGYRPYPKLVQIFSGPPAKPSNPT
jgi:hypothetical protein